MLAELWLQVVLQQGFKWWERVSSGSNVADLPSRGRARSACVAGTCRSCKGSADGRMTTTGKALGALFPLCDCVPCPLSSPRCLLLGMPTAFGAKRVAPSRSEQAHPDGGQIGAHVPRRWRLPAPRFRRFLPPAYSCDPICLHASFSQKLYDRDNQRRAMAHHTQTTSRSGPMLDTGVLSKCCCPLEPQNLGPRGITGV